MENNAPHQDTSSTAAARRMAAEPMTIFALLHMVLLLGAVGTTAIAILKSLLHTV